MPQYVSRGQSALHDGRRTGQDRAPAGGLFLSGAPGENEVHRDAIHHTVHSAFQTNTHFIDQFQNKTAVKGTMPHERDLLELFDALQAHPIPRHAFQAPACDDSVWKGEDEIDFHNLSDVLNLVQQEDTRPFIYLPEVGNSYFASYSLRLRANALGCAWLTNPWYAAMGTSLPYARIVAERIQAQQLDARTIVISGKVCRTVAEFSTALRSAVGANQGIYLIEIPCEPSEQYQCRETKLLNLYIRSRNGNPEALQEWSRLIKN